MTIEEYLEPQKEKMPQWLIDYSAGNRIDIKQVLSSRIVYYPGAFFDGQPVKTFNRAHYAHVFVYVDYFVKRSTYLNEIKNCGFRGYHILHSQAIQKNEIINRQWMPHVPIPERGCMFCSDIVPFCETTIFERDENVTDEHGNKRFVMVYLSADGIATYDALFGNGNYDIDTLILQDHGLGGNYDRFGKGGLMDRIARASEIFPKKILCDNEFNVWGDYAKVDNLEPEIGGMHNNQRYLFERQIGAHYFR